MLRRSVARFLNTQEMIEGIIAADRRMLAKAITLVESSSIRHTMAIGELLRELHRRPVNPKPLRRLAITGPPGAGKSSFIEAFGMYLCDKLGLTVGVIAVDPSSTITGGSILGDKTRMEKLSCHPKAFVRPSPSRGHLGGVTARCWEAMELLEAAAFDVILVETVGVGQSETAVKAMTDLFLLLVPPACGDELQGIKKGIVEVADAILVTKDDGDKEKLAKQTKIAYSHAVHYSEGSKPVQTVSSETGKGIADAWQMIEDMWQQQMQSGALAALRRSQSMTHFHSYFDMELVRRAKEMIGAAEITRLEDLVVRGELSPREAGEKALVSVLKDADVSHLSGSHLGTAMPKVNAESMWRATHGSVGAE